MKHQHLKIPSDCFRFSLYFNIPNNKNLRKTKALLVRALRTKDERLNLNDQSSIYCHRATLLRKNSKLFVCVKLKPIYTNNIKQQGNPTFCNKN